MYKKYRVIAMQDKHTVLIDYGLTNGARIGGTLYIIKPHKDIALSTVSAGDVVILTRE